MAEIELSERSTLDVPNYVAAQQQLAGTRRGPGKRADILDDALADAGYTIDADVELSPLPQPRERRTPDRSAAVEPAVRVQVKANESAVVLLESDGGVFTWLLPDGPAAATRRGGPQTLVFSLAKSMDEGEPDSARRGRRGVLGWIGQRLLNPLRVRVLTFLADTAIDFAVEKIEGDRPFGLVDMTGDPARWRLIKQLPDLDQERPAKILLMIHGTFSSTVGSFASLDLHSATRNLLDAKHRHYDAVLGYDHSTLAHDPEQNARDILDALKALPPQSSIDAVAFSRGGLVLRTLAERLAPQERPDLNFDRAIFVGCTNAGTHLAEPDNWHALIDLYTNIILAGARAVTLLSGNVAAEMVASGISAIGRFIKAVPDLAISGKKLPGLAAMEPGGAFVRALNDAAPADGASAYYVIASDFEPRIEPSKGITGELAEFLIDRVVDRLFRGRDNDLVVNTDSMLDFGRHGDRLSEQARFTIPSEDTVYHTIYFATRQVAERLAQWLAPEGSERRGPIIMRDPGALPQAGWGGQPDLYATHVDDLDDDAKPDATDDGDAFWRGGGGAGFAGGDGDGEPDRFATGAPPAEPATRSGGRRSRPGSIMRNRMRGPTAEPPARDDAEPPEEVEKAPDSVDCHIAAEMQPTPAVGLPTPLFVTISPERIGVAPGPTAAATDKAVAVDRMKPIEVEVIPSRNCRIIGMEDNAPGVNERMAGPSLRIVDVPTKGSVSLRFELEGIAPGEAEIFIEARQGTRLLASFLLKPIFIVQQDARIGASQVARPTLATDEYPAMLRIYETHRAEGGLRLRFELSSEKPNIFVQQDVDLRSNFNVGAFVAGFLAKLEDAYNLPNYDEMLAEITDFSIGRTNELIPERVRQKLWEHRNQVKAIQVISEEPLIPWELLYIADPSGKSRDRNGFLAEWGLVRWMYNASWPTRQLPLRDDRVFYVIPDYLDPGDVLKGAADEREMLRQRFPKANAIEPTSAKVRTFLGGQATGCDVIHFACHGLADQKAVLSSDLLMRGLDRNGTIVDDRLTQDSVKIAATFGENAPAGMVFVNACQTGRSGEGIAGVMGFADSFIRPMTQQGVNVFVGALWSIDDKLALTFADTFYGRLISGDTLVVAAQKARDACKQNNDFTWLAYSLYGHPFAKVETS